MDTGKTRARVFCPLGPNREEDEAVYVQLLCRGALGSASEVKEELEKL